MKFVCSGLPATARSLPDAKTTRSCPGDNWIDGNVHSAGSACVSVRCQPSRSTASPLTLRSSIQSEKSPLSSASVLVLTAISSLMITSPASSMRGSSGSASARGGRRAAGA